MDKNQIRAERARIRERIRRQISRGADCVSLFNKYQQLTQQFITLGGKAKPKEPFLQPSFWDTYKPSLKISKTQIVLPKKQVIIAPKQEPSKWIINIIYTNQQDQIIVDKLDSFCKLMDYKKLKDNKYEFYGQKSELKIVTRTIQGMIDTYHPGSSIEVYGTKYNI